jgi:hypothetical protein
MSPGTFRVTILTAFSLCLAGVVTESRGLADPAQAARWTRERVETASVSDLYQGIGLLHEASELRDGLGARASSKAPKPGDPSAALRLLTDLRSPRVAPVCLARLDVTAPVPGVRQMDDLEWKWPARKALTEMGWAVVPEILDWIGWNDQSAGDLRTVGGILRDILVPEMAVAVVETHRATRQEAQQVGIVQCFERAVTILIPAIRTPSPFPWR